MSQTQNANFRAHEPKMGERYDVRFRNGTYHIFDRHRWEVVTSTGLAAEAKILLEKLALHELERPRTRAGQFGRRYEQH